MDELIFAEKRYDDINPFYTDLIPIHKKGTYFLLVMNPYGRLELYHMKNRYENNSSASIKIKVPEQAGAYLGIAEKGGTLIPIPVKLTVEAGEPTSICLDAVNHTDRSLPFEVTLKVQDKFGNLVENTTTAGVEFNDATKKVDLVKGIGSINLTAPNKAGRYKVKVQSQYGIAEKDIEIADKALNGTGNTSINSPGSAEAISEAKETMPSDEKKDSIKEVQSVSVLSDSGNIRLTWQASEGVDHYNVYRLKDGAPEKLAEVKSPEYIKKGELWKSYTFRISAVNSEGNESELSDPVGIVVTP
jgi:hypothetical protein